MPAIVRLEKVDKTFVEGAERRQVLRACSFDFAAGSFTAIRGRSGSGKTTLLNLIACIDTPDSGEIVIGGTRVTTLSARERTLFRRDQLGFVFQFFNLIPTLNVLENVLLPAELAGQPTHTMRGPALDLLEQVGLADRAGEMPDRLSGGEQQRVAIARALLRRPALVLADEPTGNLDERTGADVMRLLDEMTRQAGRALIMVTHSHQIAALADTVVTIRQGQLEIE
ncbi:MAG TPA: ABC transporter ATP-binding protein [Anaerolineales bacterium]|nr:ABC transporter ATP-binding protein [Anaerolineales bacterium]HRF48905.1 ABC transporter ATP-binding protein [Anaerolineales bacterium]